MPRLLFAVVPFLLPLLSGAEPLVSTTPFLDFSQSPPPDGMLRNFTSVASSPLPDVPGLEVQFHLSEWPNVMFTAPDPGWDWSSHQGVCVRLYNPGAEPVDVSMRVDNKGADGWRNCNTASGSVAAGQHFDLRLRFNDASPEPLWGMRGLPEMPPRGEGQPLDTAHISAFQVFLSRPQKECSLILERVSLFMWTAKDHTGVPLPFIDRFGQYLHADWPGKITEETQLKEAARAECTATPLPERDIYGGWATGPAQEATGWFRTQKIDGKWWLVTPAGTLFLSFGVDCVGAWEQTFVEKRNTWFVWLPEKEEPMGQFYGYCRGAHSMADPIGGEGQTFSFYRANLFRKYGEDWLTKWCETVGPRLKSWGLNTVANWSAAEAIQASGLPYTASTSLNGAPKIEASRGYWAKIVDVYHPGFREEVHKAIRAMALPHASNPLCLGYFVDNELAWEGVREGVLSSGPEQPARAALLNQLRRKYDVIDNLNHAWNCAFATWEDVAVPAKATPPYDADMSAYLHDFAVTYFTCIRDEIRAAAPHHLYLGCRFAMAPKEVVSACAEIADIVSFNLYYREVPQVPWGGLAPFDRPALVGEFHFGATDRGMFHPGLVRTLNQADRAASLARYLASVADNPAFVGCHWFQYVDEPVTGRWYDGENYNIGLVDVTDTPYPEMTQAARGALAGIYARRIGASIQPKAPDK